MQQTDNKKFHNEIKGVRIDMHAPDSEKRSAIKNNAQPAQNDNAQPAQNPSNKSPQKRPANTGNALSLIHI